MKIIDLLNKIAKGEEVPNEIKYNNIVYFWCNQCKIYERIEDDRKDLYNDLDNLNDEVEMIEEKKIPEKLYTYRSYTDFIYNDEKKDDKERFLKNLQNTFVDIEEKINEIIDYLQSKGE